jgi:hypothetical protein
MTCTHCGIDFTVEQSNEACSSCGSFGGCNLVKCPKCGYEQPRIPKWIEKLSTLFSDRKRIKTK